jgi:hypothetical protein
LVGAATDAGIVGTEARLPVHGVVGDASLVVGGAAGARGEGDSELVPGARASTSSVSVEAGLPVVWVVSDALVVVG